MAKFATNANGAMLLPNLVQVMESISGSVVPPAMFVCISLFSILYKHQQIGLPFRVDVLLLPPEPWLASVGDFLDVSVGR